MDGNSAQKSFFFAPKQEGGEALRTELSPVDGFRLGTAMTGEASRAHGIPPMGSYTREGEVW